MSGGYTVLVLDRIVTVVDMGGDNAPLDPKVTMESLLKFISNSTPSHSGRYWRWTGEEIGW